MTSTKQFIVGYEVDDNLRTAHFNNKVAAETFLERKDGCYFIDTGMVDPLSDFAPSHLVQFHNDLVASSGIGKTTRRFASAAAGKARVMKLLISMAEAGKLDPPVEEEKKPAAKTGEKKTRQRSLPDRRREAGERAFIPKDGTLQLVAYELLKQEGGIHIDELCSKMTEEAGKRAPNLKPWTRSDTWSSLMTILHVNRGWGVGRKDEMMYLISPSDPSKIIAG